MHTETHIQQRRPRNIARKTTGVIEKTMSDAHGIAEPLERYGEVTANQLVALYNAIHGLPQKSQYALRRLCRLHHETEGLEPWRKIASRPAYQWRHGFHHQTIYRRASGASVF